MKTITSTLALAGCLWLSGCGEQQAAVTHTAADFTAATTCVLDGMLLAEHPGPKAQIHYANAAEPEFLCDTVEMFHLLLEPEQVRAVAAVYVQDMAQADWDEPRGHWIDAQAAWYVVGGKRRGAMGPTIGSFAERADADAFAREHGGKVMSYAEVKPEMVVLDGGALHDRHM